MECNDDVEKLNWFDRHGRKRINRVINGLNVGNARSRAKLYSSKNLENWEMVVWLWWRAVYLVVILSDSDK